MITNGRSGADIFEILKNAAFKPGQKMLNSKYFVKEPTPLLCIDRACSKLHIAQFEFKGAIEDKYTTAKANEFCRPALTVNDILAEHRSYPATITPDFMMKYVDYGKTINMKIVEPYAQ